MEVGSSLLPRPLLTWEEFSLRIDLDILELWLNRTVTDGDGVLRELRVGGEGGEVELRAKIAIEGMPAWLSARLTELRIYKAMLGCRVVRVGGPIGMPMPISLVASLLRRYAARWVRLDAQDRILLVDLRRWLPASLHLHVQEVRCNGRWLELEVAPGSFALSLASPLEPNGD
jgi:hypothetical protein